IYCQLCGVLFNISRIRTRKEPREAAWLSLSAKYGTTWVGSNARDHEPCGDDCSVLYRGSAAQKSAGERLDLELHVIDNPTKDELCPDLTGEPSSDTSQYGPEYGPKLIEGSLEKLQTSENTLHTLDAPSGLSIEDLNTDFEPLSVIEDLDDGEIGLKALNDLRCDYEHIAGPNCEYLDGYNGNHISVGEMRECSTVQCLVRKIDGWEPLDDDQDFEKYSSCCLTGLARGLDPIWSNRFSPVRHGSSEWVTAANDCDYTLRSEEVAIWVGLPFHPTCFELFRRASIKALGRVATEELMNLRDYYCKYPERTAEPFCQRNDDVVDSFQEGDWRYNRGAEYLVANPIFIPTFKQICDAARTVPEDFSIQGSPFFGHDDPAKSSNKDPFLRLPSEILQAIVGYLGSKDIALLRLSSRAFRHLPISVWYWLLVEELPFIYEAWSDDVHPYKWSLIDSGRFQALTKRGEEYERMREATIETLRTNDTDNLETWMKNSPAAKSWYDTDEYNIGMASCMEESKALQPVSLPYDKTNWYKLYIEIVKNWKDLKGLQNRKRIWKDITDIISRMMEHAEAKTDEDEQVDI
ncbi:unnamed protein product, partial [Clonostachys rosea f. rosea IK726]